MSPDIIADMREGLKQVSSSGGKQSSEWLCCIVNASRSTRQEAKPPPIEAVLAKVPRQLLSSIWFAHIQVQSKGLMEVSED
jgi:hypothetical protein